jgi:hypothetical protein
MWWCPSCAAKTQIDRHGRCAYCGSDGVDRIGREPLMLTEQIAREMVLDRAGLEKLVALVLG